MSDSTSVPPPPGRRSTGPPTLPSLTGLRFLAAVLVFLFHATLADMPACAACEWPMLAPYADPGIAQGLQWLFSKAGWVGVSFFFILSGFVMTWATRPKDSLGGFYRRRLVKIFPNHLVTFALVMALFAAAYTPPATWIPNLFLLHPWFPDMTTFVSVNNPSWSLASELLFYLLFPFLVAPLRRVPDRWLWPMAFGLLGCLIAVQVAIDTLVPGSPHTAEWPLSEAQWWLAYNFPPLRLFEFVLGMVMARILVVGLWPRIGITASALLCAAGYALAMALPFQYGLTIPTALPLAFLVTAVAASDIGGKGSWLRSRPMTWLGDISFAFYLIHYPVLVMIQSGLDGQVFGALPATAIVVFALLASLVAGWALYETVEKPVMRHWGRPRPRTPRSPAGSAAAPP